MQLLDLEQCLQQTYVFGWLGPERLRDLEPLLSVHLFHPGETIVKRGDAADGWLLVHSGKARCVDEGARAATLQRVVGKGESLGVRALVDRHTWPATVRAESGVTILKFPRTAFDRFAATLGAADRARLRDRIDHEPDFEFLRRLRIFSQLTMAQLESLFASVRRVTVARGEYLFHEDDAADACFIVRSGRLQLLKNVDASQKYLGTRRDGDLVGEIELLYGTPRMAHASAATDVELFEIRRTVFDDVIPTGGAREAIFQLATDRLLQYQNLLSESDRRSAEDRLPTLTLQWTKAAGSFTRAFPFVAAESPIASGLACLAMLDGFHHRESVWQEHIEQLLWDRQTDTLLTLSRKAEDCGYLTRLVEVDRSSIDRVALPAVVEDDDGTLAVAFRAGRTGIALANPRRDLRIVDRATFAAEWNGRLLIVNEAPRHVLPWLLRAYAPYLAAVATASLLIQAFALGPPLATKVIIDRVLVHADQSMLQLLMAGLIAMIVFRVLAGLIREELLAHTTRRMALFLQVRFIDHVLRLPHSAGQHVGDFAAGFRENERLVELAYKAGLPVAVDTVALAICFGVLFALSVPLALVALVFVAAYGAVALLFAPFLQRIVGRTADTRQAVQRHLVETISSIQTIKSLAIEHFFRISGTRLLLRLKAQEFAAASALANREIVGGMLHLAAMVAILGYGATLTLAGRATTGGMVASLGIFSATLLPLNRLLESRTALREARASSAAIGRVLTLEREEATTNAVSPLVNGHLELKNVSFRYPGTDDDVLSDVTLEILAGQKVAFVGRSGSGKTTLINLLIGLYRPTKGTIHLDDIDLSCIPKSALRRQIGVVEQHPFLFEGTVADNIAKADPSVPLDRIVSAATHAGAHDFISALPQGYRTPIGERGARLSGGEKQRLMIARAVVDSPRVLILDEATSALDSGSERAIYRRIDTACAGRTVLLIAHRLGTVRAADVIVVLERGRIVEVGPHADLMARRGLYYYLNTRAV